jgi:hypothetical protein
MAYHVTARLNFAVNYHIDEQTGGNLMNKIAQSIVRVFRGAAEAWKRYPVSIGCAVAFSVVTMIRIQLDWQQQEPFNFLFNCLHWSFALGAIASLAAVAVADARGGGKKTHLLANLSGVVAAMGAFALLFLLSRSEIEGPAYAVITAAAQIRVAVLLLIGLILFVLFAGYQERRYEFDKSLFMAEKSFFLALLYGLALFLGAFGVANAVRFLIYSEMSEKVFLYIGTVAGLIGYMIFVGYFPDFSRGADDLKREKAQHQPRFIEILFSSILVPVVLALTLVLLIWAARTVFTGMRVRFLQLYSITAAYTLGGLWLHAMTVRNKTALAKTYRIVYPLASIVILIFEGWAVVSRLLESGLKNTEYIFILLGVLAICGVVFLLVKKERAHKYIAVAACLLALLAILPGVGYKDLPVSAQVNRLEKLLTNQGMLNDGTIFPAATEPDEPAKRAITDAVYYLLDEREAKLPAWFTESRIDRAQFKAVFGFKQEWPAAEDVSTPYGDYRGFYLSRGAEAIPVGGYDWAVEFRGQTDPSLPVEFTGENGNYAVAFLAEKESTPPVMRISLNGQVVVEQSLLDYYENLAARYGMDTSGEKTGTLDEMSVSFETDSFDALLVLDYADFSFSASDDRVYYHAEPHALFLKEK